MLMNLMMQKTATLLGAICWASLTLAPGSASASVTPKSVATKTESLASHSGAAKARLIEICRLNGRSETRPALDLTQSLLGDYPNFALAQLVYADLLSARTRPLNTFGDVPADQRQASAAALADLRAESAARLKALKERPPAGFVPAEFVLLSGANKHAIAVDASRSQLYLFENRPSGLKLADDYYSSVGKLGVEKQTEGDQRTPLGVYFITSQLDPKSLKEFYGSGALPINYPNMLDVRRGKTGGGIWLHGTPPDQFSRAPQASDGCVVIASQINWVAPSQTRKSVGPFESRLYAWRRAKSGGNLAELNSVYASNLRIDGKSLGGRQPTLTLEVAKNRGRELEMKDLSLLHWQDKEETMVVTFGEVAAGQRTGTTKRQYWQRHSGQWTIFYEGVI